MNDPFWAQAGYYIAARILLWIMTIGYFIVLGHIISALLDRQSNSRMLRFLQHDEWVYRLAEKHRQIDAKNKCQG